jgi:pantetheine-phosphate adenylyltransferase
MTREAIYAGSFDPWSYGHSFVLESSLEIFDTVHICVAVNPSKTGMLSPARRSFLIAKSLAPFYFFSEEQNSYSISSRVTVSYTYGLVSDFARKKQIRTLLRGLRSTSDFESEFNLYFSNYAISPEIKTWTVLCPPELLHCSSTFVRTVVGQPTVTTVGTGFLAQCMLLERPTLVGEIFDLILGLGFKSNQASSIPGASPASRALQLALSNIFEVIAPEQLYDHQTKWVEEFRAALRTCQQQIPDAFDLSDESKDRIYVLFSSVISQFLRSLMNAPLSDQTAQVLEVIRLSQNRASCVNGLADLWSPGHE